MQDTVLQSVLVAATAGADACAGARGAQAEKVFLLSERPAFAAGILLSVHSSAVFLHRLRFLQHVLFSGFFSA